MARKKASQLVEQAESRRRFAEAASAASRAQQQQQPSANTQGHTATTAPASAASSSSLGSTLPPNYTLSAEAIKCLNHSCEVSMDVDSTISSPFKLAKSVIAWENMCEKFREIMHCSPEPIARAYEFEIDLFQCILELEDAPMDSLSPQFQQLKQGFEEIPLDASKPKGIERRVNKLMREGGEVARIKTVYSDWKLDHSTIPPTRVVKTDQERHDEAIERQVFLKDLQTRKPQVHAQVQAIMAESVAFMPARGPAVINSPDGRQSHKFHLSPRMEAMGYGGTHVDESRTLC